MNFIKLNISLIICSNTMKVIFFITVFVVQTIILLMGITGMLISVLDTVYPISTLDTNTSNTIFVFSGAVIIASLIGIINFLISGIVIYYCFNRKYSWLHHMMKYNPKYKSYQKVANAA